MKTYPFSVFRELNEAAYEFSKEVLLLQEAQLVTVETRGGGSLLEEIPFIY
jgi:hypothetical protein